MELSPKFAYLPNGIIREIVAYTGATFKKRNGKYMGQIPKTDPRFVLLLKIPKKQFAVNNHPVSNPNCRYFTSWVHLKNVGQPTVCLSVFGVTYINDPILGNSETIKYECRTRDRNGNERYETYEYYRKNEQLDMMFAECKKIRLKIDKIQKSIDEIKNQLCLLQNVCIMFGMFTTGLIIQYFR